MKRKEKVVTVAKSAGCAGSCCRPPENGRSSLPLDPEHNPWRPSRDPERRQMMSADEARARLASLPQDEAYLVSEANRAVVSAIEADSVMVRVVLEERRIRNLNTADIAALLTKRGYTQVKVVDQRIGLKIVDFVF